MIQIYTIILNYAIYLYKLKLLHLCLTGDKCYIYTCKRITFNTKAIKVSL